MTQRAEHTIATWPLNEWSPHQSQSLNIVPAATPSGAGLFTRLIRLDEINEERHLAYRQALANVYASLDASQPVRLLYLLDGGPGGVNLYFGVVADSAEIDLHEAMKNLRGVLEGQLPGINFGKEITPDERLQLLDRPSARQGVLLGTPTAQEQAQHNGDEQNFQDIDRLVRAMQSGSGATDTWLVAIVSQPLPRLQILEQLDSAYALSSQLTQHISTNVQFGDNSSLQTGTSSGTSESQGSSNSTSKTAGDNRSITKGSNSSDTSGKSTSNVRGKSEGGSENRSPGRSSSSSSTGSSQGKNWGTSESRTTGDSSSFSKGKSDSKTVGISTSDSRTKGKSHTSSTNEGRSQSETIGHSLNVSKEITDKRIQHEVDYLDKQLIPRLQNGLTKGLFHCAVYLAADNTALYQRLKHTVRATFQGSETTLAPLQVYDLPPSKDGALGQLLRLPKLAGTFSPEELLFSSLHADARNGVGSLMTAEELAIVASLPQHELQGVRRRRTVEFVVYLPDTDKATALDLGEVMDRGRRQPNNRVHLAKSDLSKHVFVTGVTGAGKTNTCLNLLIESGLPFLVIEPAKTEYRELATHHKDIDYYRPNGDEHQSLRINPFALVRKEQRIKSHAGFLKNVFAAVFPMEASMPALVEAAILAAYEDKGWDVDDDDFLLGGDPFAPTSRAWPTMTDMIGQLDRIIPSFKMGKDFEEKYRGSLVSRLRSLTDGTLGQVLDVPQSLSFDELLGRRAVIELEELQGGEEKALLMALLLGGINEAIRARFAKDKDFRHLTLIEEAHRLLSRPEAGDKAGALAVEAFADMLAEVRKYGEGLIIADQIPAKLIPDVIKNTHTKIVHRLFAEDDRRAMGEAMMMDDEQRGFLPNLKTGEAIVFCGGWHGPAHALIRKDLAQTDNHDKPALDLYGHGVRQLWRERTRYFPQFCRLGWLNGPGDDPQRFAQFVRSTRQAQKQLLRLIAPGTQEAHAAAAFTRLKEWHVRWHSQAEDKLAAAWEFLLLDANPRPHADKDYVAPLAHTDFLVRVSHTLVELLARSENLQDWLRLKSKPSAADLRDHLVHLSQFKSI